MKVILVFLFAIIALHSAECQKQQQQIKVERRCNTYCPAIYNPVCAKDQSVMGGKPQTFASECLMEVNNCLKNTLFEVIRSGPCETSRDALGSYN